ncbi:MAG: TonB-dependent receptor [Acidobacteria bacterium]|nr:TonB-dependent receptor [Acidobacteriota bacterium]
MFAAVPSLLWSQGITTGGIAGTVVDPTGAVVQGAKLAAVNVETGAKFTQQSQADGNFSILNLPIGQYDLTIDAAGFNSIRLQKVKVVVGQSQIGKQVLKPGASQTVEVTDESAALLNTTDSQISTIFSSQQLSNLPLQGGFDAVALLQPGVVLTHASSFSNNNGASFSSQGQRGRSNNFELDGQSNNDNSVAGPQVFFSNQDALAGVQVITNDFSAQYGRNTGSVVNYLTKSGTNQIHGSAFEYYEGNWGESFAQNQKDPSLGFCATGQDPVTTGCALPVLQRFVQNRFGGTLGLPIIKDKLWGFGSTYFSRNHAGGGLSISGPSNLTPTPNGLQQLQAAFPNNPAVAAMVNSGPYSIKTGGPQVFGATKAITVSDGTTSAPIEFGQISRGVPSQTNDQEDMGRLDWQPTTKDHFFARYFYQDDPTIEAGGNVAAGAWYDVPDTAHSVGADWTRTYSPSWVNQIRYSFQQTKLFFQSGAQANCTVNTPGACTSSISLGSPFLGYGYPNNLPQGRVVKNTQVQDNATWIRGNHTLYFGGEWDYQNSPNGFLPNYNGTYKFGSFSKFLQQSGTVQLSNGNYNLHFTEPDAAGYIQDVWRVSPALTLNTGLRWEFFGQAVNLLHDETVARESNPATAFWDTSLPLSERTFPSVAENYKNFQPRFGFAWNPQQLDNHLVVNGGFAINFDPAFYNMFLNSATAAPVINAGPAEACGGDCLPSGGITGSETRAKNLGTIPLGVNPNTRPYTLVPSNFHNPYTESWQLGFEYGPNSYIAIQLRYVGNHGVGNFQSLDANPNLLATAQAFPNVISPALFCTDTTAIGYGRPNCNNADVRLRANTAFSNYNALEFQIDTKAWHNLTTTFSYTYSRAIDNTSDIFGTFGGGNTITFAQNPFDSNVGERGQSGISVPHVINASFVYDLPWYKGQHGLMGRLLGGFEISGLYNFDTGQPTTPFQFQYGAFGFPEMSSYCDTGFNNSFNSSVDTCRPILSNAKAPMRAVGILNGALSDAPNGVVPGTYYDLQSWLSYVQNGTAPTAVTATSERWLFNNKAIAKLLGTPFGGVGRNTLGSQNYNNLNATILKNTRLTESVKMQFSISAYNALNRQYFGTLDPEIDDPTFMDQTQCGPVCSQGGSNRNVEIGARLLF